MVVNLRQPDLLVVVKKDEGEAALRSDQGVEINRHDAPFIRKYNTVDNKVATELQNTVREPRVTTKDRDIWLGEYQVLIQPLTRLQRMTKVPVRHKDYVMTKH